MIQSRRSWNRFKIQSEAKGPETPSRGPQTAATLGTRPPDFANNQRSSTTDGAPSGS
jgi:hypothetical protein